MLHIIFGNADAVQERFLQLANDTCHIVALVPEQFTLQTELEILHGLHLEGYFHIEVLSPSRLTDQVFVQSGSEGKTRIDGQGKQLAVARAAQTCQKALTYYETVVENQGFLQQLGTLIGHFKEAGVTPVQLTAYAEAQPEGAAQDKMKDLALLYTTYAEQMAGQYMDGEDVLDTMLERLPKSGLVKDSKVIAHHFDELSEQTSRILLHSCYEAKEVYALLVAKKDESFYPILQNVQRLENEAKNMRIPCDVEWAKQNTEPRPNALVHLCQEWLQPKPEKYDGTLTGGNIRLYAAPNPFYEAHFAAQEILLKHQQGIPFDEMSIVYGDASFGNILRPVLESYQIPAYVSQKLVAAHHGACRFLLASLRAIDSHYAAKDMIAIMKSGYAPISQQEGWLLENYVTAYGIRGGRWLVPFTRGKEEECNAVERARDAIIKPLEQLRQVLRVQPDAEIALRGIYDYLEQTQIEIKIQENQQKLVDAGLHAEAMQNGQLWESIMQLLRQAHSLLEGVSVNAHKLRVWLQAGLEACQISALPPTADTVVCGEINALPLMFPQVLFVMNMNDNLLGEKQQGLLTIQEQETTQKALRVFLSQDEESRNQLVWLNVWKAFCEPQKYLYLTHTQANEDGSALRPFVGLNTVRDIFPDLQEEGGVTQQDAMARPLAKKPAMDQLGVLLRRGELTPEWADACRYLKMDTEATPLFNKIMAAFNPMENPLPLSPEVTHRLFMERAMSVSRLESFSACPYRHFVQYGLNPVAQKEYTITPLEAGNFYHSALEGFTRLLPSVPEWPKVTKKECDALIDRAAQPLFDDLLSGVMQDSARMRSLSVKYRRVLQRVAWTFTKGAQHSAFQTVGAEVKFGFEDGLPPVALSMPDGRTVYLRGVIDRIDRYAGDEGVFLRTVDYKSGNMKLDPAKVYWGLQMQLLIYLMAALQDNSGSEPAGTFYMHLGNPTVAEEDVKEDLETVLAKALRLQGVAVSDLEILQKMDDRAEPVTFSKRSPQATLEEMKQLIVHARNMAAEMASQIYQGEIRAKPTAVKGQKLPCTTCDYKMICRRGSMHTHQFEYMLDKMKFDELLMKCNQKAREK